LSIQVKPLTIWRITDGKPGHDAQSLGLATALAGITACRIYTIETPPLLYTVLGLARRSFAPGDPLPGPDLIIGAGHGTHLPLLCARAARGGRIIVLMRPGLPASWFDLCMIPEHDGRPQGGNVVLTRGALNAVIPAGDKIPDLGLILIGGPSRHYHWDEKILERQIRLIVKDSEMRWTLTDSARTPAGTRRLLGALRADNLAYQSCHETPPGWLAGQLARCSTAWITEDSVSMLYEALTAGAAIGILNVPAKRPNKISAGVKQLIEEGIVTSFENWDSGHKLKAPPIAFNESSRCAKLVLGYFPPPTQ
jgi:mitochondrial fission protein ELM1